jgi:phosphatidate cytidylyltransferase
MTELQQRIITAAILIPLVLLAIFGLDSSGFKWAMAVVLVLGCWEWCRLIGIKEVPGQAMYIAVALVLAFLIQFLPSFLIYLLAFIWWLFALYLVFTYPQSEEFWHGNLELKAAIGLALLLPTWLGVVELHAKSPWLMLFVFMLVWAADIGAYFSGKRFGKTKLAPKVSPGKSIEGLLGGLLAAVLLGLLLKNFVDDGLKTLSLTSSIILFALVILFSVLGDLSESLFKRVSGVKDSSQLLPGHGGILDRIDSMTAAVPIFWMIYLLVT